MIEYRAATPRDADAIAGLHTRSWRESYRGVFPDAYLDGPLAAEHLQQWRERLERPPSNQLVQLAIEDAGLLGFVCVHAARDPRWGSLVDNLHVAAAAKRRGIGAALMRQAGEWLQARHPDAGVYLFVFEGNAPARRFYERLGGENAGVSTADAHAGDEVRSCRYVWPRPSALTPA